MIPQDNMAARQKNYAVFLPALSSFYAFYVGKQRYENYVDPARIPSTMHNGVEGLNFLNPNDAYFYYPWCLYSAGLTAYDTQQLKSVFDDFSGEEREKAGVVGALSLYLNFINIFVALIQLIGEKKE
jgi:hypothetical protein